MLALLDKVLSKVVKRAAKLRKKMRNGDHVGCAWYALSCMPLLVLTASLATLAAEAAMLSAMAVRVMTGAEGSEVADSDAFAADAEWREGRHYRVGLRPVGLQCSCRGSFT